jgi:predicted Zn-dependent peptidase
MLTTLLSEGKSSRLQQTLVDEQQKAMEVFSYPFFLEDPGLFIFFAIANQGVEVKNLKNTLNKEIKKVQNELISKKAFQKLQNQVEANFYSKNTKVKDIAINLAWYELFLGDANLINTELQKYQQVTRKDLKRVANKYLKINNRTVLYYLPKRTEP